MDSDLFISVVGWILLPFIGLGSIGNRFSFIIWTRGESCKNSAASVYLTALSVADTVSLLSATDFAYEYATKTNYVHYLRGFMCRIVPTFWHFTMMTSSYIVVCVTVDRVIAVFAPFKAARWTSKRKSLIAVIMIVIINFALNLPWLTGYKTMPKPTGTTLISSDTTQNTNDSSTEMINSTNDSIGANDKNWLDHENPNEKQIWTSPNTTLISDIFSTSNQGRENISDIGVEDDLICGPDPDSWLYKHERKWHHWFINFVALFIEPIGIIIVLNIAILFEVVRQKNRLQTTDSRRMSQTSTSDSMTARVIAVCFVHYLTFGPISVAKMVPAYRHNVGVLEPITMLHFVFDLLWIINHGSNFVLYSAFGTAFRKDFRKLFCVIAHISVTEIVQYTLQVLQVCQFNPSKIYGRFYFFFFFLYYFLFNL